MAHLYLDERLTESELCPGLCVTITGDEARHAVRVSRLRAGERTLVGNGDGVLGIGEVTSVSGDSFTVLLDTVNTAPPTLPRLGIIQALAKGDRGDRAVELATEFGADVVLPWAAQRSIVRWTAEKSRRGVAKWQRIAREASKQSLRSRVPHVGEVTSTSEICALAARDSTAVVVLDPGADLSLGAWASNALQDVQVVYLVVGPEGGITDEELRQMTDSGALALRLGETVLRTSSAGPAALAVLNAGLNRW